MKHVCFICAIVDENLEKPVPVVEVGTDALLEAVPVSVLAVALQREFFDAFLHDVAVHDVKVDDRGIEGEVVFFRGLERMDLVILDALAAGLHFAQVSVFAPQRVERCNLGYLDIFEFGLSEQLQGAIEITVSPVADPLPSCVDYILGLDLAEEVVVHFHDVHLIADDLDVSFGFTLREAFQQLFFRGPTIVSQECFSQGVAVVVEE